MVSNAVVNRGSRRGTLPRGQNSCASHPRNLPARSKAVSEKFDIFLPLLNEQAQEWLEQNPQVSFHYTPTHASWVNLAECFFSILTRQGLQQSVHRSNKELVRFLKEFVSEYNKTCGPFV